MANTKGTKFYHATDEEIIEALNRNKGIIYYTADEIGYSRAGLETRIRNSEVLKEAVKNARQTVIDNAEKALFELIDSGDFKAIEFTLRKIGRERGYGDIQDINMNANVKAEVELDMSKLSKEELEKLDELTAKITNKPTGTEGTSE